jgi:two-component system chemotaxis response regulator CheY
MTSVIVIDDNEDIVYSMSELLELYGINVIGKAYDGLEGAQLFDQIRPDAVLLDLMMPKYDGQINDEMDSLNPTKILFKPIDMNNLVEILLDETNNSLPFKIEYSFKDDSQSYTCLLTFDQYKNFKNLPAIAECKILKNEEANTESYEEKMQEALNLAAKNDVSHIQKLSQMI